MNNQSVEMRDVDQECSTLDGSLALRGQADPTGVTTFANEACEEVQILKSYYEDEDLMAQADLQDIKTYFERPRLIGRGTIPFGNRAQLAQIVVDRANLQSWFPQWTNRLSGAYGISFTLNFRLQVAATAFHQGIVVLSNQYGYSNSFNTLLRGSISGTCTNLPHVRLDVSETTMAELKVPFLYHNDFFPILANSGTDSAIYSLISLNAILPSISVSGLSAATYELFLFLSDIKLYGADNAATTVISLQSGGVVKKELQESKLLSGSLAGAAKVANFVSRNVPSLAALAGPTAWALETASGIAKYFGYSRPMLQDPPMRVIRMPYSGETNVDVPMAGFTLGTQQCNTLAISPNFGATDVDEMAFEFIKKQWSQINIGQVSTSNTHNQAIYASPVSMSCFWFRAPAAVPYCNWTYPANSASLVTQSGNCFMPSSLMNLASFFRQWRGGIKFRFTFAKTKFHGGRYMISYNPSMQRTDFRSIFSGAIDGPENVSGLVQPYGYSMIIDLKDGNVFEFVVPYMVESPWCSFESSIGGVSMVCIDPLQASGSVTTAVPFMVEICGDDDFEVNDYSGPYFVPQPTGTIYTQSGGVVRSVSKDPSPLTMGEKLNSVKQIIQSPWWGKYTVSASTVFTHVVAPWFTNLSFQPINAGAGLPNGTSIVVTGASNPSNIWAKCYAYAKGGTDIHVYTKNASGGDCTLVAQQSTGTFRSLAGRAINYSYRSLIGATPKVVAVGESPLHVRMPAFQMFKRIPTHVCDGTLFSNWGTGVVNSNYYRSHFDFITVDNQNAAATGFYVARAAADDAALAHYMGPVPYYIPNSTNTNNIENDWTY